jgi:Fe-S-cluster-containing dehydrogenase component
MRIRIDHSKCCGCKLCEVVCSLRHTDSINLWRSRIRVFIREEFCLPVIAGPYTEAACNSKGTIIIDGKEVDGCILCRASCPVRSVFKEPDTAIPLKCDCCGEPPDPQCVKWCAPEALSVVEEGELP